MIDDTERYIYLVDDFLYALYGASRLSSMHRFEWPFTTCTIKSFPLENSAAQQLEALVDTLSNPNHLVLVAVGALYDNSTKSIFG
jgi:hypothetical protein